MSMFITWHADVGEIPSRVMIKAVLTVLQFPKPLTILYPPPKGDGRSDGDILSDSMS
jgi:hypothetical protein